MRPTCCPRPRNEADPQPEKPSRSPHVAGRVPGVAHDLVMCTTWPSSQAECMSSLPPPRSGEANRDARARLLAACCARRGSPNDDVNQSSRARIACQCIAVAPPCRPAGGTACLPHETVEWLQCAGTRGRSVIRETAQVNIKTCMAAVELSAWRHNPAQEDMMLLLDTATIPVADRIEVFNTAMLDASVPMTISHEQPDQPIHARMQLWSLGVGELFTSDNSGFRLSRARRHLGMDGKPYLALALQARGLCRYEQFGHQQVVRRGHLMLNDLTAPYDVTWSGLGGSRCFQLPYDRLGLPLDVIRAAVPRIRASPLYDLVRHHLNYLSSEADRLQDDPGLAALGNATTELLRALIASAAAAPGSLVRQVRQETLLTRILTYARRHLTE